MNLFVYLFINSLPQSMSQDSLPFHYATDVKLVKSVLQSKGLAGRHALHFWTVQNLEP